MEPAPALETIFIGLLKDATWPKLMLPNEVTLVTPLPSTQPLMIEALTVKPWLTVSASGRRGADQRRQQQGAQHSVNHQFIVTCTVSV